MKMANKPLRSPASPINHYIPVSYPNAMSPSGNKMSNPPGVPVHGWACKHFPRLAFSAHGQQYTGYRAFMDPSGETRVQ